MNDPGTVHRMTQTDAPGSLELDHHAGLTRAATQLHALAEACLVLARQTASSTELAPSTGPSGALATRAQLADARADLTRKQQAIKEAQELLRLEFDRRMAAAREALAPMQELVERLAEGVAACNLYLGRDEEIVTLRGEEAEPAPADTPLTVRQLVLFMDEESAIGAEHGGMDATNIDEFDQWLLGDPAHVDQIIPEQKAVVALMPRRSRRDYGDPWTNLAMAAANSTTYFLVRNGARLYRLVTKFDVGVRLVPSRNEFLMPLTDRFDRPLEPGSRAWVEAEKAVSARERHFLRVALILQGLIDRSTMLHPLPPGGLSLLTPQGYDDGRVRLLDDEHLTLTTGRAPFSTWIAQKMALLRPGMRVVLTTCVPIRVTPAPLDRSR